MPWTLKSLKTLLHHHYIGESKRWNTSSLLQRPCRPRLPSISKDSNPNQDFVSLYVSPVKNARQEHYAKDFDHVHYPQTTEDLAQICQELAGDYDTIFYASFDNRLILDLVLVRPTNTSWVSMMAMRIFIPWVCMLGPSTQSGRLFRLDQRWLDWANGKALYPLS